MEDIKDNKDIKIFVDQFYMQIKKDLILAPIFLSRIEDSAWPAHLERMYSFWNTVLFGEKDYRGNPFSKHATLRIHEEHFHQWLTLFRETIDLHYKGPKAEEAKLKAQKMAQMFESKLAHIRSNSQFKNII